MTKSYQSISGKRWVFWTWVNIDRDDGQPYLRRLIVLRCPWLNIYLHLFLADDEVCLHDHAWSFLSLILWGGYWEHTEAGRTWHRPGTILFRRAKWRHRIQCGRRKPVTLVLTGRRRRTWGFWTRRGFIPWYDYSHRQHCVE